MNQYVLNIAQLNQNKKNNNKLDAEDNMITIIPNFYIHPISLRVVSDILYFIYVTYLNS